ncbi:hypothetical protein GCM10010252_76130 [Streptomyces aureoverticillatus]|nr:hypothetical protein GCM10010252_76130 [Streptomyces aureoverticillatus]
MPRPIPSDGEWLEAEGGNALEPGDEEQPAQTGFPVLDKLKESVGRSKMHPIQAVRKDERASEPWSLFHQAMDGEPGGWVHPDVTREKIRDGSGGATGVWPTPWRPLP